MTSVTSRPTVRCCESLTMSSHQCQPHFLKFTLKKGSCFVCYFCFDAVSYLGGVSSLLSFPNVVVIRWRAMMENHALLRRKWAGSEGISSHDEITEFMFFFSLINQQQNKMIKCSRLHPQLVPLKAAWSTVTVLKLQHLSDAETQHAVW